MIPTGALFLIMVMLATTVSTEAADSDDPLQFPEDDYTERNVTVNTSSGEVEVTCRLYQHITYVANPVDTDYQSMNVKVPIKVDSEDVDTTNAPILFAFSAPGYKSAAVSAGASAPANANTTGLALAAGYVVVEPGCRGSDNLAIDGTYYGKAPAAIVDLKAAVRYIRHNDEIMPGNAEWIISVGASGGGALSALLGASGNSHLYDAYFEELGVADEDDSIYASADFCPITDLEHADMAYEWEFGTTPLLNGNLVNQKLSQRLKADFAKYQASLNLQGENGFGDITADNYGEYLVETYLIPSANKYLRNLTNEEREAYLANKTWITWFNNSSTFTFEDYVTHGRRIKNLPAFDAFSLSAVENILFGNETTNARHFTKFGITQTSGRRNAEIDDDLKTVVNRMNPMYFISQDCCSGCAEYWWIRHGTNDTNTALTVIINLATILENKGKEVNVSLYWDAKHMANEDPEDFIAWIGEITGYTKVL
ncbi:MAG: hypothetical protein NTY37_12480 [Methanothrix sp.]|nr:hypothetical protein [Methanothrix sp.]